MAANQEKHSKEKEELEMAEKALYTILPLETAYRREKRQRGLNIAKVVQVIEVQDKELN